MNEWIVVTVVLGFVLLVLAFVLFTALLKGPPDPTDMVETPDDPWDKRVRAWLRGKRKPT